MELGCRITYRVVDPASAVASCSAGGPEDIVVINARVALKAALGRLDWPDLVSGHALPDCTAQVKVLIYV